MRELPSRESCSAPTRSAAWSSRIEARAARVAALDSAFSVHLTVEEILYSDDGEGKYDDTSDEGNKDKDGEDDRDDAIGGNDEDADKGSEVDEDEDYVAKDDNDDDDDDFYKSSLFDDDDDDSVDNAKYCVPLVRGAGAGHKPKSGHPDKPNTDGMSEKEKKEALGK